MPLPKWEDLESLVHSTTEYILLQTKRRFIKNKEASVEFREVYTEMIHSSCITYKGRDCSEQRWLAFFSFLLQMSWNNIFLYIYLYVWYVWVYAHVCGHMCKRVHVEAWGWCWRVCSITFHLIQWGRVSQLKPRACHCDFSISAFQGLEITGRSICPPNIYMDSGESNLALMLHGKHFKPLSHLSSSSRSCLSKANYLRSPTSNCQWKNKLTFLLVDLWLLFS